jgi:hypothetical protein
MRPKQLKRPTKVDCEGSLQYHPASLPDDPGLGWCHFCDSKVRFTVNRKRQPVPAYHTRPRLAKHKRGIGSSARGGTRG